MSDSSENKMEQKRAAVAGGSAQKRKKSGNSAVVWVLGALIAMTAFGAMAIGGKTEQEINVELVKQAQAQAQGDAAVSKEYVEYPVAEFDDGKARFYNYTTADGLSMRYFILKSKDGKIRTALDACDACWEAGKGYRQDGDQMVCNNCRMRFDSNQVMEVSGGCNPSPLKREVADGKVRIRFEDIEKGRMYFDLPAGE